MDPPEDMCSPSRYVEEKNFLTRLPFDIQLMLLVRYLGPKGTASLRCVCKELKMLSENDNIWKQFCCNELRLSPKEIPLAWKYKQDERNSTDELDEEVVPGVSKYAQANYYQLYTKLICPFRGLFDKILWSFDEPHGELLTLTFVDSLVVGQLWWTPMNIMRPMIPSPEFVFFLNENGEAWACLKGNEYHQLRSDKDNWLSSSSVVERSSSEILPNFVVDRTSSEVSPNFLLTGNLVLRFHERTDNVIRDPVRGIIRNMRRFVRANEVSWTVSHVRGATQFPVSLAAKFAAVTDIGVKSACFPSEELNSSLPRGFFKGTYGSHGTELLRIYPENSPNGGAQILVGKKLRGDVNVPAGKDSFRFPLDHCVILGLEEQDDIDYLETLVHVGPFHPAGEVRSHVQPFRLPADMLEQPLRFEPGFQSDTCMFRVVGSATIANTGYRNPQSTPAHLVVLSPTRFIVLWLGLLCSASLFEKVSPDDPINRYL